MYLSLTRSNLGHAVFEDTGWGRPARVLSNKGSRSPWEIVSRPTSLA